MAHFQLAPTRYWIISFVIYIYICIYICASYQTQVSLFKSVWVPGCYRIAFNRRDIFLAATKQLYGWFSPSARPSVCLITKFSGVVTNARSDVHAKAQGQRSKVKVTEVNTQLTHFRTITPVWIHIWWWNDAQSLMLIRRGALLFLEVIYQISRSHDSKNRWIWPKLGICGL